MIQHIDLIIVFLFILFKVLFVLLRSQKTRNISDYAIANKSYSLKIVTITTIATATGSGATIGNISQIVSSGAIYILIFVAHLISILVAIKFIAPNINHRFAGCISINDMVDRIYGKKAGTYSSIVSGVFCTVMSSVQIVALSKITAYFYYVPSDISVIIWGLIITTYCLFGGIKAVTMTDVIQFFAIIFAIALICISIAPTFHASYIGNIEIIKKKTDMLEFISLFLFFLLPVSFLYPPIIQRYLMLKKRQDVSAMLSRYFVFKFVLTFVIIYISMWSIMNIGDTHPSMVLYKIIDDGMSIGAKGVAIAGILSVTISSADSYLNSAGINLASYSYIKNRTKGQKSAVNLARLMTLLSSVSATVIALLDIPIFDMLVICSVLNIGVIVPLFMGIISKKKPTAKQFFSTIKFSTGYLLFILIFYASDIKLHSLLIVIMSFIVFMASKPKQYAK